MNSISIENLQFGYDKKVIFNDLSLSFQQGDFCSILGPNGSGKTTLLKCIVGLLQPSGGSIQLYGKPMSEYKMMDLARKIAYVPQYQDIVFDITVYDYVMLGRNPYQTPWQMQRTEDNHQGAGIPSGPVLLCLPGDGLRTRCPPRRIYTGHVQRERWTQSYPPPSPHRQPGRVSRPRQKAR